MKILTNIKRLPIELTLISLLATFSTVLGCGVMPAGQVSTRTFNVSGFTTLPVNMVYAGKLEISIRVPGIAANSRSAQAFVERLVMQTVFDVLESQARTALLPDAVISLILSHLTVKVSYTPMQCQTILSSPTDMTENHKRRHGELVASELAKCTKQSDTNSGIWFIWIALFLGNCHCWRKLKST
ncbi:hypothetical protein KIN20_005217 [Parelaphostrongylus tenuis]|uniref:Uncharacterized protein n=1 Tax=Parelaphostrongylus tenuis TaxID=148309 RepID=A0AAD5LZR4_PARTN|nr:hypothetical protein KIN20_005217 [Parelaphostrongylus tenuis]